MNGTIVCAANLLKGRTEEGLKGAQCLGCLPNEVLVTHFSSDEFRRPAHYSTQLPNNVVVTKESSGYLLEVSYPKRRPKK